MKKKAGAIAVFLGLLTVAEAGGSAYFYRRTMKRGNAKKERTMKMAGTDWNQYLPLIQERKDQMLAQPHEDVYRRSEDGLRLHATWFPAGDQKKTVICFHGYTSQGMSDYIGLSAYYMKRGYSMLLVDERSHGDSEGEYIGFGCLDRMADRQMRGRDSDPAAWDVHGRGHGADGQRPGTARSGQGDCLGLRIHLRKRGIYACASFHVPSAGVSDDPDRQSGE